MFFFSRDVKMDNHRMSVTQRTPAFHLIATGASKNKSDRFFILPSLEAILLVILHPQQGRWLSLMLYQSVY